MHLTDATNTSRTALDDIGKGRWDEALCEMLTVPMSVLPEVRDSTGEFGVTDKAVLGGSAGARDSNIRMAQCAAAGKIHLMEQTST
ncbi:MAG TPA: FGGY family carbohydrate kinase [Steroidobacteraceae bacterium]|nr:FGGY family carbohydrate kinase [Steroidobacteraceae bacterium]